VQLNVVPVQDAAGKGLWCKAGRKLKKTIESTERGKAEVALACFQENLNRLERGHVKHSRVADLGHFLFLTDTRADGVGRAGVCP